MTEVRPLLVSAPFDCGMLARNDLTVVLWSLFCGRGQGGALPDVSGPNPPASPSKGDTRSFFTESIFAWGVSFCELLGKSSSGKLIVSVNSLPVFFETLGLLASLLTLRLLFLSQTKLRVCVPHRAGMSDFVSRSTSYFFPSLLIKSARNCLFRYRRRAASVQVRGDKASHTTGKKRQKHVSRTWHGEAERVPTSQTHSRTCHEFFSPVFTYTKLSLSLPNRLVVLH